MPRDTAVVALALALAACGGETPPGAQVGDAGTGADAGPAPCAEADGAGVLAQPDPRRSWAGVIVVVTEDQLATGTPPAAVRVDGVAMPPPQPTRPVAVVDTRALTDGVHRLALDLPTGGAIATYETAFCVANGGAPAPPFTGGLVDIAAEAGLGAVSAVANDISGAVAGDLDGDGDLDLFAWGTSGAQAYLQTGPLSFVPSGPVVGGVQAAGMGDLDGDGDPDVVAAGASFALLRNDGGTLVDVTASTGFVIDASVVHRFRSVGFADVDADGLLDVALTQLECKGAPNHVLRNEGALRFVDVAPALGLAAPEGASFGMALDVLDERGDLDAFLFHEGCTPGKTAHLRFGDGDDLPVLLETTHPKLGRISPMGSAWLDVDADGALDLSIAGDFTSPAWTAPDFFESASPYVGIDAFVDATTTPISAWSHVVLDADLDGHADLFVPHHPSDPALADAAGSRDALFWRRAPGELRDVAAQAGLGQVAPCRAAQGADLDGDGDTDLLVGCAGPLRVLRNDLVDPAAGRSLVLQGSVSNPDGAGAIVTTASGETRLARGSGQPYAGGIVRETVRAGDAVDVRWPSGLTQHVASGEGSLLVVREPAVVTALPRRVAAGQSVEVAIDPRPLGDAAAAVKVDAPGATWITPLAVGADGVHRGTLTGPAAPATIGLRVTIGALTLRVRPRVFVR